MKLIYKIVALSLAALAGWVVWHQTDTDTIQRVISALESGDATQLSGCFDDEVKVTIQPGGEVSAKTESLQLIEDFFAEHPPVEFIEKHRGVSRKKQSTYLIGELLSQNGNKFRLNILFRNDTVIAFEAKLIEAPI